MHHEVLGCGVRTLIGYAVVPLLWTLDITIYWLFRYCILIPCHCRIECSYTMDISIVRIYGYFHFTKSIVITRVRCMWWFHCQKVSLIIRKGEKSVPRGDIVVGLADDNIVSFGMTCHTVWCCSIQSSRHSQYSRHQLMQDSYHHFSVLTIISVFWPSLQYSDHHFSILTVISVFWPSLQYSHHHCNILAIISVFWPSFQYPSQCSIQGVLNILPLISAFKAWK